MKKIKLSISDDSGNISIGGSPLWRYSLNLTWEEAIEVLGLKEYLVSRLRDWKRNSIKATIPFTSKEEKIKCEIEGLSILLELRKELPNFQIEYQNIFGFNVVLNEERVDDDY